MKILELWPILLTGLGIASLHAAIPTHWLPFVMASRSQKWSWLKTQKVIFIAGFGHILMTTLLGVLIFLTGREFLDRYENTFLILASSAIFLFGVYNVIQHLRGQRHSHCKNPNHHHHHAAEYKKTAQDGWAILSLLSLLTFSPCESFLPVYLSAVSSGWVGFIALSIVLAVGTLSAMVLLTWLSLKGMAKLELHWLEDYEKLMTGVGLILLSILVFLIESHHH